MNRLAGTVAAVETDGALSLVDVAVGESLFSALVVETPDQCGYLAIGCAVELLFKETEVAIAKDLTGAISLRNRHRAVIESLRFGGLLCEVTFKCEGVQVISLITARSAKRLELAVGDTVEWLIKANEISLRPLA
ncbi:MAG: molybdopterin-binding protein [Campylobacterales bacterium]